jgi:DNA-directed RNA polymerase subunit L
MNVNVSVVEKQKQINGLESNFLRIRIEGKDINYTIPSTIVRTVLSILGSYTFDEKYIDITSNSSVYNNSIMRSRLMNFPLINRDYKHCDILNTVSDTDRVLELEERFNTSKTKFEETSLLEEEDDFSSNLHMFVNAKNTTDSIMNVSTDDDSVTFQSNGRQIPSIYPRRSLIIKLKPGEEFICSCVAVFNLPIVHSAYSPVSTIGHREESETSFIIKLQSSRQLSEEEILRRACRVIIIKLQNFMKRVTHKILSEIDKNSEIESTGKITIENENHTIGNVIARAIQDNKYIESASYLVDHPEVDEVVLIYKTQGKPFTVILKEETNKLISIYTQISHKIK